MDWRVYYGVKKKIVSANRRILIFLNIIHQAGIGPGRADKKTHDTEYRNHDEHTNDAPEHTLSPRCPRLLIVGIPDIRRDAVNEVDECKRKHDRNDRV